MAVVNIPITIPDARLVEVLDFVSLALGYTTESGLTKQQFVVQEVREFIKNAYQTQKIKQAALMARQTTLADINSFTIS